MLLFIFIGFIFIDVTANVVYRITNKVKNDFPYVVDDEAIYCHKKGIFDWSIYEKSTLGNESKRKWYAVILSQWMEGSGLSYIMQRAIDYHKQHPENFRVSAYQPPTIYNDNSKEHRNVVFGLLLTLVLIFASQTEVILSNPLHIVLIAIPLTIQTVFIFFVAYIVSKIFGMSHDIAAPAGMIGASNFFELAVAVAITLFGTTSPAALATTVGVLTEVPVMLALVKAANNTKGWFKS